MEFSVTLKDIEDIEKKEQELAAWLMQNFSSFGACAFVLQSVTEAVEKAKKQLGGTYGE